MNMLSDDSSKLQKFIRGIRASFPQLVTVTSPSEWVYFDSELVENLHNNQFEHGIKRIEVVP